MSAPSPSELPPMNHVFVDFENVQKIPKTVSGDSTVSFMLLMGANQPKLDAETVARLMTHSASVHVVRMSSQGKDAVDFALCYYLGQAVMTHSTDHFHIVSKDGGFDPLVAHLKSQNFRVRRHGDFSWLTASGPATAVTLPVRSAEPAQVNGSDLFNRALAHLKKNVRTRPKREKTLVNQLRSSFKLSEPEAADLITQLRDAENVIIGDKGSVKYKLK